MLTSSYPAHQSDYRGGFVREFALNLVKLGWPVRVLAPSSPQREPEIERGDSGLRPSQTNCASSAELSMRWLGQGLVQKPWGRLYGGDGMIDNLKQRPWDLRHLPSSMMAMAAACRDEASQANLVMAHWLLPFGLVAALERSNHGRPVWIVCHSGGVRVLSWLPRALRQWVARVLVLGCDLLSFPTFELKDLFLQAVGAAGEQLRSRCRILPMGIDCQRFSQVTTQRGGPIVVCSRLTRLKAVDRLIRSASRLSQRREIRIIGDGPERGSLEALASELGVSCQFLGELAPHEVPEALAGASLAAVPSRRLPGGRAEGSPVSAIEALASGLPLLTTDSWDMPAYLSSLPGVFRAPDSQPGLDLGLKTAMAALATAGPEEARARILAVRSHYDWAVIGALADDWLRELQNDGPRLRPSGSGFTHIVDHGR